MPIQFPSNPTSGQTYTYNGIVYSWTGQNWRRTGSTGIAYDTATTSTGYFDLPSGTTAQRPTSPPNGAIRQNTTTLQLEYYSSTYQSWMALQQTPGAGTSTTFDLEYLVVAGGGGGGSGNGGGGGGGAGTVGTAGTTTTGGNGGIGANVSISGAVVTYSGGGGGGTWNGGTAGTGGLGGGGSAKNNNTNGDAGTTNTGGGGGGGGSNPSGNGSGGAGGSGIVILRIPNIYTATFSAGLTVATSNTAVTGYRVYSVTAGTGTVTFA